MSAPATCIIQARSGSTRLPGKVVADLAGRPMLGFMLERLEPLRERMPVVVATTTRSADDPVAEVAASAGAAVVRGPEADVLERFRQALADHPADVVVRLTGDCPLADAGIVDQVLALHAARGADYTCNVLPRTFPQGLDVEVVSAPALLAAAAEAKCSAEREHVTPFVYRRPERFRLANLRSGDDLGRERWTVDTAEDLVFVREVVAALGDDIRRGWRDILAVTGRRAQQQGLILRPATLEDSAFLLELRNDPEAVRWSRTARPVAPDEHARWIAAKLEDPACRLEIATVDGVPIGMLRLDVAEGTGEVSVAVAPDRRGEGLGNRLLGALVAASAADQQIVRLTAFVHPENEASDRAFRRAGFTQDEAEPDGFVRYSKPTSDCEEAG